MPTLKNLMIMQTAYSNTLDGISAGAPSQNAASKNYDEKDVKIAYAHPDKHKESEFWISAQTFVHRLLSHVPEKGSHVVRSFGLLHPNCRETLDKARYLLGQKPYEPITDLPSTQELLRQMFPDKNTNLCPNCGSELRTVYVYRRGLSPTWRLAA